MEPSGPGQEGTADREFQVSFYTLFLRLGCRAQMFRTLGWFIITSTWASIFESLLAQVGRSGSASHMRLLRQPAGRKPFSSITSMNPILRSLQSMQFWLF